MLVLAVPAVFFMRGPNHQGACCLPGERGRSQGAGQGEGPAGEGEVGPEAANQGGHGAHGHAALAARPQGEPHQGAGGGAGHGELPPGAGTTARRQAVAF